MAQGYLAQVQALIAERMKENPEEMKRKLKEIEKAKKKAKEAPKSPPKPIFDPQLTQELIWQLDRGSQCKLHVMKDLIKRGADIKVAGKYGTTLHQACWRGDLELIELCFQSGVDPNLEDYDSSDTALNFAKIGEAQDKLPEIEVIFSKYGAL